MRRIFALAVLFSTPLVSQAQLPPDFEKKVDSICKDWDKKEGPGGVVGVAIDGKLVFSKGYGLANIETKTPNTPETVMDVGSVSKQFTAMCILLLEEQGKLKTSDDFTKYIPEVSTFGKTVTIDHLLHMTSGLRDYLTIMAGEGWNLVDSRTFQDAIDVMARQTGANDPPGEVWNYCNAGYMMMAVIVERVSGKSLAQFAKEAIFNPLDMKETFFQDNLNKLVAHRATSYTPGLLGGYQGQFSGLGIYGDGGVHTTLADMTKWHENFYKNQLGLKDQKLIDKMLTTAKLKSGKDTGYACGLVKEDFHGTTRWQHGGNWLGFNAMTARLPEKHISIFTFGNDGTNLSSPFNKKIGEVLLGFTEPSTKRTEVDLSEDAMKPLVGSYALPDGRTATITLDGKQLSAQLTGQQKFPVFAESETKFFFKIVDAQIEFKKDSKGAVTGATIFQGGQKIPLTKGEPFKPTEDQLKAFVGRFQSFEMNMEAEITLAGDKLTLKLPEGRVPLIVVNAEKATVDGLSIDLMRDATGIVRGITLDMGRAKGMKFLKRP